MRVVCSVYSSLTSISDYAFYALWPPHAAGVAPRNDGPGFGALLCDDLGNGESWLASKCDENHSIFLCLHLSRPIPRRTRLRVNAQTKFVAVDLIESLHHLFAAFALRVRLVKVDRFRGHGRIENEVVEVVGVSFCVAVFLELDAIVAEWWSEDNLRATLRNRKAATCKLSGYSWLIREIVAMPH